MKKQLEQIKAFNKAFEIIEHNKPSSECYEGGKRSRLMQEELDEYKCAIYTEDMREISDALVDMQYILLGMVRLHGLQDVFEQLFDEVHKTNMAKLHDGKIVKNDQNKVIKPDGWKPPRIAAIVNTLIEDENEHI